MTTAAQRGTTTVSDKAVRRIAERAATEALPGTAGATKGSATVRGRRAEVAVEVPLPYPAPLADTARRVQDHVARRTAQLTGLDLRAPHIGVTSLTPARAESPSADTPLAEDTPAENTPAGSTGRTPLRWWSQRRLPMALLTLSAAIACGALAFDLVLVHTGHRPPAAWRTATLDWLSRHGPSATASTVGAVAVALLGVVLIVLAVTPGRRGLLTVTSGSPRLVTAVDRSALASLVEDAVRDTDGIGPVRVRAGRRRVTVRAGLAFGDRDRARSAVRDAARRVLEGCDLRRTPRLRVTVRPEPVWDDATAPAGPLPSADLDKRSPDADSRPPDLEGAKIDPDRTLTADLDRTPTVDPDRTPTIDLDKKGADQGIYPANRGSDSGNRGSGPATARETPTDPQPTDPRPTAPGHPPTVPGHRRPGSALVPTPDSDPSSTIPDRLASPHSPPAPASDHPQTDTDRPHLTPDDPHLAPDRPQATHDRPHITSDPNGSDPEGASR
ncbi:Asp23/Gls24 family envelope stress response protein [Streptomyces griseoviridis]|uniref:Asp23/Gls24 family envelope stress response protein n=1 Tax=Streptomyces griseoviridis TaxID=45398 RepID=A0A3S9ZP08_STRGD|nr:DUF6286 domain-containing protein [Streptomyces griseoviridis]AZS89303.1 Asp23/Gls24 family envelope stress response protein [Streptomyces griseoviridis]QCN83855.1 hypothetical protein DDJ31_01800 [Streptomyces griseoviridis]